MHRTTQFNEGTRLWKEKTYLLVALNARRPYL